MGIPDRLTCLLRNLYANQETTVRTGHGTTDWSKLGKVNIKAVYCHLPFLTYMRSTSYEMLPWMTQNWNQDCSENTNNLRYADDTTLMAESKEELKSLVMKVKEESEKLA